MGAMHIWSATLVAFLAMGVAGCTRDDGHRDSAAREAGKSAYKIAEDTRKAAKKAGSKLRAASREAREGWNEAKDEARSREKK